MIGANASVSIQTTSSIHAKTSQSVSVSPSVGGGSNEIRTTRRRFTVWASFVGGMTAVAGILLAGDRGAPSVHAAVSVTVDGLSPATDSSLILPRDAKPISGQWQAIVIHHSATPAGDSITLNRQHTASGLSGLGYHFVIGNGQGMEDGQVAVGFRWERQLPGAHANAAMRAPWPLRTHEAPLSATDLNRKSVAICLVGNGERRAFTDQQTRQLLNLVRALQAELGIGAQAVFFHRELTPMVSGLGEFGQLQPGTFRAQLLP